MSDPANHHVMSRISKLEEQFRVEFTPQVVGPHTVRVRYGGQEVAGSPYICNVYDSARVRIMDISHDGIIGSEMGFTGEHRLA